MTVPNSIFNPYTVSFFGHRMVENSLEIESRLELLLRDIMDSHKYVEFLVGRDGEFDILVASVIHRLKRLTGGERSSMVLVLPYPRAEVSDNEISYSQYYDEIEVCDESSTAHFKSAIQVRNKNMVDRSNLVICYITRASGGAGKTVQYARKNGTPVTNIADMGY